MARYLEISPEVAAILGPRALAQARDTTTRRRYTCPVCDQPGTLGSPARPAALIAWHYLPAPATRLRYAHAACAPSALITINARTRITADPGDDPAHPPAPARPAPGHAA